MHFKNFVAVAAVAAATSISFSAYAQDVHTLTPHFPDAFKVRTTTVSDALVTIPNGTAGPTTQSSHSAMAWTTDTHKTAEGYHATIAIESMDLGLPPAPAAGASPGAPPSSVTTTPPVTATPTVTAPAAAAPPPVPAPSPLATMTPADLQQKMTAILKLIGNPEVSYDSRMRPVRIDNLDALKANVKNMIMVGITAQDAPKFSSIFDLFVNDITPESAASLLRQSTRSRLPFDKPLPLNTTVPLDGTTFELYGATLAVGGTATLDSWEDGKTAHLTLVTAPPESDMHMFLDSLVDAFMNKAIVAMGKDAKPEQMTPVKVMIKRFIDGTAIRVTSTCKVDVDLNDTALTHSDCMTDIYARIDTSKFMTDEQIKANPEAAAKLQVITFIETVHSVSDTVLVN